MSASKKCKLYHVEDTDRPIYEVSSPVDWTICALCQKHSNERLQCPGESKQANAGAGYITIDKDLHAQDRLG